MLPIRFVEGKKKDYFFIDYKGLDEKVDILPELDQSKRRLDISDLICKLSNELRTRMNDELCQIEKKANEAQKYYCRERFWGPLANNKDVHIFTCGRDMSARKETGLRGLGGRTNIDMWDYITVLDIAHYFASNYPNAAVTIEDPISKLNISKMAMAVMCNKIADLRDNLANRDCIIIGSPDVSDYAEIVLSEWHGIDPYNEQRIKRIGFVIVKDRQELSPSSFYWKIEEGEKEGVIKINGNDDYTSFPHEAVNPQKANDQGLMHGILTFGANPFCTKGEDKKIVILSGLSGVATNSLAKILTADDCLNEFFKFDNAFSSSINSEALFSVSYEADKNLKNKDTRRIKNLESIKFECLVDI